MTTRQPTPANTGGTPRQGSLRAGVPSPGTRRHGEVSPGEEDAVR